MKKDNVSLFPVLLVLYEIATYLSNDAYLPALPSIAENLNITTNLAQLTLTMWFIGSASVQLILGPISDRFGRRPVLLSGGIIYVIASIICALTTNINIFLICRFAQGMTIPSMIIAGYATIHELFDHNKAINILAWMYSITVLAPAFGPLLGAAVLHFTNWRMIFWILAIWTTLTLSFMFLKMPETNKEGYKNALNLKIIFGQYKRILSNIGYMKYALSYCFLFASLISWIAAGPFLSITEFNYGTFGFSVFQIMIFGSYITGTKIVKPLTKKYKSKTLIKAGLTTALSGGTLAFILSLLFPHLLMGVVISTMLIAGSTGFCSPMLNRHATEESEEPMGARVAIFSGLISFFGMFGSAIINTVYNGTLLSLSSILLICTTFAFLFNRLNNKQKPRSIIE